MYCDEVLREGEPEGVEERQSVAEEESVAFLFCSEHAKKKKRGKKKKKLASARWEEYDNPFLDPRAQA